MHFLFVRLFRLLALRSILTLVILIVLCTDSLLHKLLVLTKTAVRIRARVLMMKDIASKYDSVAAISLSRLHQVKKIADLQGHLLSFLEVINILIQELNSFIFPINYH